MCKPHRFAASRDAAIELATSSSTASHRRRQSAAVTPGAYKIVMVNDRTLIWKPLRHRLPSHQLSRILDPPAPSDGLRDQEQKPRRVSSLPGLPFPGLSMSKQFTPVWRVYRIEGRKAVVVATLKYLDGDSALRKVLDDLGVTDSRERERFFVRQDD